MNVFLNVETPIRTKSEKEGDTTLTMDSLIKTPKAQSPLTVSGLDVGELGLKNMDATIETNDSSKWILHVILENNELKFLLWSFLKVFVKSEKLKLG